MERREFLGLAGRLAALTSPLPLMTATGTGTALPSPGITLFLSGDVMTGRGIDQILDHPGNPTLHEPYVKDARHYVELAETANGPIARSAPPTYIWGDALEELAHKAPDARIINLETAVTQSDDYWRGKEIHYRMHPRNIGCLTAAEVDCCTLANNHLLDWGHTGLIETIDVLSDASIAAAGAGPSQTDAEAPALLSVTGKGRVVVFSIGSVTSGIPHVWAARGDRPGLHVMSSMAARSTTIRRLTDRMKTIRQPGDLVVLSIHWGGNWGYDIPDAHRELAHRLIDDLDVHVVHGHSSHHPIGIEVYRDRPILYGCGDFLNDYEGIRGYEEFKSDRVLGYFVTLDPATGRLIDLTLTPFRIQRFSLRRASREDTEWLGSVLDREGRPLGTTVEVTEDARLHVGW